MLIGSLDVPLNLAANDSIAHVHLDYRGQHALVSTVLGDNFYVNMKLIALKPLRKLKGHVISAVGWNHERASDQETGFIALGTAKGQILETGISSTGSMSYCKVLASNFGDGSAISSIHIAPHSIDNENRWVVEVGQVLLCV